MVDPEIPVLTIADLGVLREVAVHDGRVEVAITPTYSGCPAMNMIALEIELALERAGIARPTIRTVLSPAWTTDWMSEDGRRKLREYGIAPPQAVKLAPRAVRRAAGGLSAMRLCEYRAAVRVRLDLLQGAVALQEPAANPLIISSVIDHVPPPRAFTALPSTICAAKPRMRCR